MKIILSDLIAATVWTNSEEHIKVQIWHKNKVYEKDEWENIDLTVKNLSKYGAWYVEDIDIEEYEDGNYLSCVIVQPWRL